MNYNCFQQLAEGYIKRVHQLFFRYCLNWTSFSLHYIYSYASSNNTGKKNGCYAIAVVYYLITNVYDHATVAASPQSINHTGPPEYEDIIINVKEAFHFKSLKLEIYGLLTTPMLALKKCLWCEIALGWLHRQLHMNMNETACYNLRCSLKGKIPLLVHPPSVWSAALITAPAEKNIFTFQICHFSKAALFMASFTGFCQ